MVTGGLIGTDDRKPPQPSMRVLLHDPARWPAQRAALEEVRSITSIPALIKVLKHTSHSFEAECAENEFDPEGGAFAGVGALAESMFEEEKEWWSLIACALACWADG